MQGWVAYILYTVHNYSMGGQKKDRLAGVGLKCML